MVTFPVYHPVITLALDLVQYIIVMDIYKQLFGPVHISNYLTIGDQNENNSSLSFNIYCSLIVIVVKII